MIELLHMDCMEYMAGLPDKAFDLAIVDPPYGIPEAFKGGMASSRNGNKPSPFADNMKEWDILPAPEYFVELRRISKNQIIWGGNYFNLPPTRGVIAWVKPQMKNHPHFSHFELGWTSFKRPAQCVYLNTLETGQDRIHSTQKPIKLYRWLLHNYAKPGDRILDTHLGSASSAIAAHQMGFDFVGTELDKDYYEAAVKRFNNAKMQQSLF